MQLRPNEINQKDTKHLDSLQHTRLNHQNSEVRGGIAQPHQTIAPSELLRLHILLQEYRVGREVLPNSLALRRRRLSNSAEEVMDCPDLPNIENL